jgi:hypothetical protein
MVLSAQNNDEARTVRALQEISAPLVAAPAPAPAPRAALQIHPARPASLRRAPPVRSGGVQHHRAGGPPPPPSTAGDEEFARRLQQQFQQEDGAVEGAAATGRALPANPEYRAREVDYRARARAAAAANPAQMPSSYDQAPPPYDAALPPRPVARREPQPLRHHAAVPAPAPPPPAPPVAPPEALWPGCKVERAVRKLYDTVTKKWETDRSIMSIILHNEDFGEGGLRNVRRLREVEPDGQGYVEYVAKWFKFEAEKREWYYAEAEAQMVSEELAQQFNRLRPAPPKKVGFVPVFVLELIDRPGRPLFSVEPLLSGAYEKHNANDGGIFTAQGSSSSGGGSGGSRSAGVRAAGGSNPKLQFVRNTPQAFSHFTYAHSEGRMVVCDIQGVDDMYTDPQIHTLDGKGFGQGNMGPGGIKRWMESHVCNDICRYLKLDPIKGGAASDSAGGGGWSKPILDYASYIGCDKTGAMERRARHCLRSISGWPNIIY